MADASNPPSGLPAMLSIEELYGLWARFRKGDPALCPRDGAPLALAVDGAAAAYRFVCTECIIASPWFEADASGVRIRGQTLPVPADKPDQD